MLGVMSNMMQVATRQDVWAADREAAFRNRVLPDRETRNASANRMQARRKSGYNWV